MTCTGGCQDVMDGFGVDAVSAGDDGGWMMDGVRDGLGWML